MTLGQVLRQTVERHGDRPAYVTVGKDPTSISYRQAYERVGSYTAALLALGLEKGDRAVIVSENCPEWAMFDWACQCLGVVVVPIYPSLPADQVQYIVQDCGAKIVIAGDAGQKAKIAGEAVVLLRGEDSLDSRAAQIPFDGAMLESRIATIDPEDPCTIIYTSGTTGLPKGAVMPNRAFVHVAWSAKKHLELDHNDTFLSFLPMSHVYERVAGQVLPVYLGATICFSRGLAFLAKEMAEFSPSLFLCVPRFLENFRDRVLDAVAKDKPIRQRLFHLMLNQGLRRAKGQFAPLAPALDKLVAAKVRARLGSRFRYFVSGGAALEPAVAEFFLAIGVVVLQGYGLTETSGGSVLNMPENNKYWTVGEPLDMELQIAEDGEILMRGPGLMLEYYHLPEETAAAIDADGWFHTGDIGEFEGTSLKITDRKKDIIVLGNGKNVAPKAVENRLKTSPLLSEVVVFGDKMDHCVALVLPNGEAVRKALGLSEDVRLDDRDDVRALLKKEIDRINRTTAAFEAVKKFAIIDQPFTVDSGELTPTLKVKRRVVKERYADLIASLG